MRSPGTGNGKTTVTGKEKRSKRGRIAGTKWRFERTLRKFMMGILGFRGTPGLFVQECAKRGKRKRSGRFGKWKSAEAIENKERELWIFG
jgi:hypothetical protein